MQGTRIEPAKFAVLDRTPGGYMKVDGIWVVCLPNGAICHLNAGHRIIEHADGTITVSPSILLTAERGGPWHGYLIAGEWREV